MAPRFTRFIIMLFGLPIAVSAIRLVFSPFVPDQAATQALASLIAGVTSVASAALWLVAADVESDKSANACAALFSAAAAMFASASVGNPAIADEYGEWWVPGNAGFALAILCAAVWRAWRERETP